jgi:hypothetical protein
MTTVTGHSRAVRVACQDRIRGNSLMFGILILLFFFFLVFEWTNSIWRRARGRNPTAGGEGSRERLRRGPDDRLGSRQLFLSAINILEVPCGVSHEGCFIQQARLTPFSVLNEYHRPRPSFSPSGGSRNRENCSLAPPPPPVVALPWLGQSSITPWHPSTPV